MEEETRCRFCKRTTCQPIFYDGKTWNPGYLHEGWNRTYECYEIELDALKALLSEAEEIVSWVERFGPIAIEDEIYYANKATVLLLRIKEAVK